MSKYFSEVMKCSDCGAIRGCCWVATTPFKGYWLCVDCNREYETALADIVKAANVRLAKMKEGTNQS